MGKIDATDMKRFLSPWIDVARTKYYGFGTTWAEGYRQSLMIPNVIFSIYYHSLDRLYLAFDSGIKKEFETIEEAKNATDQELIYLGYILLSQDQWDKYRLLL